MLARSHAVLQNVPCHEQRLENYNAIAKPINRRRGKLCSYSYKNEFKLNWLFYFPNRMTQLGCSLQVYSSGFSITTA